MTYTYKWFDEFKDIIERTDESGNVANIPLDAANTDYQDYLEWAKSNTIQEAD